MAQEHCPACTHPWDDHAVDGCQAQVQISGAPYDCNCMEKIRQGLMWSADKIATHGNWSLKGTQVHKYNRPEDQQSVPEGLM